MRQKKKKKEEDVHIQTANQLLSHQKINKKITKKIKGKDQFVDKEEKEHTKFPEAFIQKN